MSKHLCKAAFVFSSLFLIPPAVLAQPQQYEVLELKAANYDPVAGIWHDTSGNGNDAIATTSAPALTPSQTLNGSPVVTFDGTNFLTLQPGISSVGFTAFAYVRPLPGDSRTIVGGDTGSFQYRIGGDGFGDAQEVLQRNLVRLGVSNTQLDTSGATFSNISINYSLGGTTAFTFRFDEASDGSPGQTTFSSPTNLVGAASGPGELYIGDIAEIRIYNTVLSDTDRATIEEQIRQTYEP